MENKKYGIGTVNFSEAWKRFQRCPFCGEKMIVFKRDNIMDSYSCCNHCGCLTSFAQKSTLPPYVVSFIPGTELPSDILGEILTMKAKKEGPTA